MSNVRDDVMAEAAGTAHRASWASDAGAARALAVSRQTTHRWTHGDRYNPLHKYITKCDNPYAVEAMAMRVVKQQAVDRLTLPEAIVRYREILERDKIVEMEDTLADMQRGLSWEDRAKKTQANVIINLEKHALQLRFAAEHVTESEVLG